MDAMEWLLILGIAAILLILYDGQRRERKTRIKGDRCAVVSSGPSMPPLSLSSIDEAETASAPRRHLSADAACSQHRHGPAPEESVPAGSFIGASIHVIGHVEALQPLTVAGRVEGEITLHDHDLTIPASGEAGPAVRARQLTVNGHLNGAVQATDSVLFQASARFEGELKAGRLRCMEGAELSGQFNIG